MDLSISSCGQHGFTITFIFSTPTMNINCSSDIEHRCFMYDYDQFFRMIMTIKIISLMTYTMFPTKTAISPV